MSNEINYKNNPLHGVGLKSLLIEIVDQYGFDILFAYLNINCFKTNPSIDSSVKFLKKTDWAREKVEVFYLYEFNNLPRASSEQFSLPPRERIIPEDQTPGDPKELSLEDAERLREKRANKSVAREQWAGQRPGKNIDPWANRKKNRKEE
ncbi:MAG: VF530 family DNA-binding protein [Candidatus Thiodiazotropha sp. (ex Lucinoma borealis)]|nr:VF530 family DNA-binding protein [Candidatus Thiodiazotropha sp. (ex Troendleina suluensis)]MCU7865454.1 VF530 family DNA-binding protein [Candidatus Thiodiazotropha sp. (ex Lucinoma borealis)]